MTDLHTAAFDLVSQALTRYIDLPAHGIQMSSVLKDMGVDSLTLAELLFELEDRIGQQIPDVATQPVLVSDVVALLVPYLAAHQPAA